MGFSVTMVKVFYTKRKERQMIVVTQNIALDEREIQQEFIRSAGPGGQNINKVATAVQLRFDVQNSPSLPEDVRQRLIRLAGKQITDDGVLIITARQHRTQDQNRQEAVDRLVEMIRRAAIPPKARHKTKPTGASKLKRLDSKRRHSEIKRSRRLKPDFHT
jgi:ribosome-associated protein